MGQVQDLVPEHYGSTFNMAYPVEQTISSATHYNNANASNNWYGTMGVMATAGGTRLGQRLHWQNQSVPGSVKLPTSVQGAISIPGSYFRLGGCELYADLSQFDNLTCFVVGYHQRSNIGKIVLMPFKWNGSAFVETGIYYPINSNPLQDDHAWHPTIAQDYQGHFILAYYDTRSHQIMATRFDVANNASGFVQIDPPTPLDIAPNPRLRNGNISGLDVAMNESQQFRVAWINPDALGTTQITVLHGSLATFPAVTARVVDDFPSGGADWSTVGIAMPTRSSIPIPGVSAAQYDSYGVTYCKRGPSGTLDIMVGGRRAGVDVPPNKINYMPGEQAGVATTPYIDAASNFYEVVWQYRDLTNIIPGTGSVKILSQGVNLNCQSIIGTSNHWGHKLVGETMSGEYSAPSVALTRKYDWNLYTNGETDYIWYSYGNASSVIGSTPPPTITSTLFYKKPAMYEQ